MIKVIANSENAYKLMHEGVLAFARAERQGIRIDMDYCEMTKKHIVTEIQRVEEEFKQTTFFKHWQHSAKNNVNIYSNFQLARFLYQVKKIEPPYRTTSGQGSTDEESLQQLNIPELNLLLSIRKMKKIKDTYLDGFVKEQVNGVLHPFFNLHLVRTFRSSSNSPNFQNIPKRDEDTMLLVRRALFPRIGHQLMEIDYSSLEVRIAACYHNDPTMIKYITDPTTDMHRDMAVQIFKLNNFHKESNEYKYLRKAAKGGFVFPQFYGDYYKNNAKLMACNWCKLPEARWRPGQGIDFESKHISDHLISQKITSLDKFTEHIKGIEDDFWNRRFPVYQQWKNQWWSLYQKNGYIDMHTGFRCSGIMKRNDAINYPVQGAAFHCLLWSFIELDKFIICNSLQTKLIGQIHDAIVLDIYPPELEIITKHIRYVTTIALPNHWKWINVPLDIDADLGDVNDSWADLKPYKI